MEARSPLAAADKHAGQAVHRLSVSGAAPPLVPKTFLNEQHCVPVELNTRAGYTSATFQLNSSILRNFYTQDNPRLVYYVDDLRLDDPYDIPPCNGTSRWRSRAGACAVESAIDAVVKGKLVAAIAEGSSEGGEVLDLQLQEVCASGSHTSVPIAASVTVDGASAGSTHTQTSSTCTTSLGGQQPTLEVPGRSSSLHSAEKSRCTFPVGTL